MKKRIIIFTTLIITFFLAIMTSMYLVISNHKYLEESKNVLNEYNKVIALLLENDNGNIKSELERIESSNDMKNIRITYISKDGNLIFDTHKELINNNESYLKRQEIIEAIESGLGSSVRYSNDLHQNMIYSALKLKDGSIVRTSIAVENAKILDSINSNYLLVGVILSLVIALLLTVKITNIILNPLKELEQLTSTIASGNFHKRVKINSKDDEIQRLGKSFNYMAEQLEITMERFKDKQNGLEAILKSMGSGVIAFDRDMNVLMINPYAKKIFGISGEIIGNKLLDYITDKEIIKAFCDGKDRVEIEVNYNDDPKILKIRKASIINEPEIIGTVVVIQDITDIKKLENMRSQFVANISHELKTPLTSIKGFAETLRYVDDDETRNKFLSIIDEESDRLARLLEDILCLYEIEQKRSTVLEEFNVDEEIEKVYMLLNDQAKKKGVEIFLDTNSNCVLMGDKDKFKQMLLNLVSNSVKYTEKGGKVRVESYNRDMNLVLVIEDNGIGISAEDLPRIFERFYRVDKARSRESGGTGLGLAIVKHIVRLFDGEINVTSELGVGTKIVITIPINI
ncbi:two-component system histidine kinase PnpS [Clostridium perfringens]|uniref:histidine kinase n=1 Tax=Clostridium perfringens TaxID=1502 RepID=A0A133NEF3_CLOPF|nr:ATP-binding protein [Clostridium perfringens]KXA14658.1 PAS domain S-box protein [Clostridium perfringens]MBS5921442.1 HAMP domain-containing protein [Clostridium perfringens]